MKRKQRHIVYFFLALLDVALIVACYLVTARVYMGSLETFAGLKNPVFPLFNGNGLVLLLLYACITVAAYVLSRVYGAVYLGRIRFMAVHVLLVNSIGIIIFAAVLYVLRLEDVSRMTLFLFYVVSTCVIILKQWVSIHIIYRWRKSGRGMKPVLVVGCGPLAQRYANTIGTSSERIEHVMGFVTPTNNGKNLEEVFQKCPLLRKCFGYVADLDEILERNDIEEIVIALETEEYDDLSLVSAAADRFGTALVLVPFYNDAIPRRPEIDSVQGVKLVNLRSMPLANAFNSAFKRAVDIVLSTLIIIIISWFMLLIALGVKLSSPGPVFFRQERVGRDNKTFMMLKFRSMRVNDESDTAWSTDEDPRKTKFGQFIRKLSIDELPQFFNVFKGDMSIIGPRPEIPYYVDQFRETIPRYMLRHQVRPGVSGWAQVNGYRGDTSIEKRIEYDLWYIEHWSFWLDTRIFFRTIFGGFINSEKLNT